jgi:hypothetical protein
MNPEPTPESLTPTASPKQPSTFIIEPMEGPQTLSNIMDNLLKHPGRLFHACQSGNSAVALRLLLIAVMSLSIFGLLLGSFSGGTQLWASPLKITLGMIVAVMICLPSLYIFSALDGLNARLYQIVSVLLSMVALSGLLMLGFAPVIWVFSTSTDSLGFMGFLALIFWVIGLYFGTRLLLAAACSLGLQSKSYLKLWIIIFTIVTLQMSTSLRPLIGTADTLLPTEKRFFLQHWFYFLDSNNPPR